MSHVRARRPSVRPQSCKPLADKMIIHLDTMMASRAIPLDDAALPKTIVGVFIGAAIAALVACVLCGIRSYYRRQAAQKGLYTFGSAPGADGAELSSAGMILEE